MKQLAFVLGLLTLSVTAATQAHADLAVVRFNGGYCRSELTRRRPLRTSSIWRFGAARRSTHGGNTCLLRRPEQKWPCMRLSRRIAAVIGSDVRLSASAFCAD